MGADLLNVLAVNVEELTWLLLRGEGLARDAFHSWFNLGLELLCRE